MAEALLAKACSTSYGPEAETFAAGAYAQLKAYLEPTSAPGAGPSAALGPGRSAIATAARAYRAMVEAPGRRACGVDVAL